MSRLKVFSFFIAIAALLNLDVCEGVFAKPPDFYPLPNGQSGFMDRATKEFLESKLPNPTQATLDKMLAEVDCIKVRPMTKRKVIKISQQEKIAAFRKTLKIIEDPGSFGHCMCFGDPQIYLFKGKEQVGHLSCQHGFAIRWNEKWKWDAKLKDGMKLTNWLAENGAPELKACVLEDERRAKLQQEAFNRFVNMMPRGLGPFKSEIFSGDLGWSVFMPSGSKNKSVVKRKKSGKFKKYWINLEKNYPNSDELVLSLLSWNGSGLGPWTGMPTYETFPPKLLDEVEIDKIVHAIKSRDLKESEVEGAAKYFSSFQRAYLVRTEKCVIRQFSLSSLRTNDLRLNFDFYRTRSFKPISSSRLPFVSSIS